MNMQETSAEPMEPDFETILSENEPITKHSARILRKQILQDGHVSKRERAFLKDVLDHGNLMDDESYYILLEVLLNGKRVS